MRRQQKWRQCVCLFAVDLLIKLPANLSGFLFSVLHESEVCAACRNKCRITSIILCKLEPQLDILKTTFFSQLKSIEGPQDLLKPHSKCKRKSGPSNQINCALPFQQKAKCLWVCRQSRSPTISTTCGCWRTRLCWATFRWWVACTYRTLSTSGSEPHEKLSTPPVDTPGSGLRGSLWGKSSY